MTLDLTRLLEEIAVAEDMTEVAVIVRRHHEQVVALPPRQYERACMRIADAVGEFRQRHDL